jgi:hypothetical protein
VQFSSAFILLLIRPTVPCWSANRWLSPKLWGHRVWCSSHDRSWSKRETIIHGIPSRRFNHSIQKRWAIQIWRYCWYVNRLLYTGWTFEFRTLCPNKKLFLWMHDFEKLNFKMIAHPLPVIPPICTGVPITQPENFF